MSPTRREFLQAAGTVAAGAALGATPVAGQSAKRRYAIVGTGVRAIGMWGRPMAQRFSNQLEFVGLCDINGKRVELARQAMGVSCPTFTDFDRMCDTAKPELLMVTTVDAFHAGYIVRALDRGIDVITEKPMVIDEQQCQQVLDAERRNNRKIVVAFNYRFAPKHVQIKEVLQSGAIGTITGVDGELQVTVDGRPVYTYAADQAPGDVSGQGVNGVWYVVAPDGTEIMDAAPAAGSGY